MAKTSKGVSSFQPLGPQRTAVYDAIQRDLGLGAPFSCATAGGFEPPMLRSWSLNSAQKPPRHPRTGLPHAVYRVPRPEAWRSGGQKLTQPRQRRSLPPIAGTGVHCCCAAYLVWHGKVPDAGLRDDEGAAAAYLQGRGRQELGVRQRHAAHQATAALGRRHVRANPDRSALCCCATGESRS